MGFDIGQLFQNVEQAASQGMSDVLKTGGNAAIGYLEGQAVQIIQADQKQHEVSFQDATMQMMQRPTAANSISAYVQNLMQAPALKEYGPYVLLFLGTIVCGSIIIGKKVRF